MLSIAAASAVLTCVIVAHEVFTRRVNVPASEAMAEDPPIRRLSATRASDVYLKEFQELAPTAESWQKKPVHRIDDAAIVKLLDSANWTFEVAVDPPVISSLRREMQSVMHNSTLCDVEGYLADANRRSEVLDPQWARNITTILIYDGVPQARASQLSAEEKLREFCARGIKFPAWVAICDEPAEITVYRAREVDALHTHRATLEGLSSTGFTEDSFALATPRRTLKDRFESMQYTMIADIKLFAKHHESPIAVVPVQAILPEMFRFWYDPDLDVWHPLSHSQNFQSVDFAPFMLF